MEHAAAGPLVMLRVAALPFESLESLRAAASLERLNDCLALEEQAEAEVPELSDALFAAAGPPVPGDAMRNRARLAIVTLRRTVYNRRPPAPALLEEAGPALEPALRQRVARHFKHRERLQVLRAGFLDAFSGDLCASRTALQGVAGTAVFREGIRLASRSLFDALASLLTTDPEQWNYDERHVASKFASYAARGAAKTSPYSVFCITAPVRLTTDPARVEGENDLVRRAILLNVFEARKVTSCLAADPAVRPAAKLRPNPTLRETEGGWTYWRPALLRRPTDEEILSRVKDLPVLRMFLEEAADPSRSAGEILRAVEERSGAGHSELARFLEDLVEKGIVLWEVEIPYNSRRPLQDLTRTCHEAGCLTPWLPEAEEIERQVDRLPELSSDGRVAALDGIQQRLERLPHVRALKGDEIFRLDAASGLEVSLPASILGEVQETMEWYARLFASLYPEALLRAGYVDRFLQSHSPDREVTLLDIYHGLFEPETVQRPASFPEPSATGRAELLELARRRFTRARSAFARLARKAEAEGAAEVAITSENWDEILEDGATPSWFCGTLFQVEAESATDVGAGRAKIALNAIFSGSGLASARLDHLHGGGATAGGPIARDVRKEWGRLEREGAILAEVTYMHWGRTANAGLRPALFRYEIELPGEKASAQAEVIPLKQLALRYDTARQRFVLRWVPRDVEVIPVVGSGISPEGFVSFLVSLGQQGFQPLIYFPGFDQEDIETWPRFTWGRTVLFRRRWIFRPGSLPPALADPSASDAEVFTAAARLRRSHELPRHLFVHTTADPKPFYMDLESPVLAELLRKAASPREQRAAPGLTLTEMLPSPEGLWVRDRRGRYASEFLVQLHGPLGAHPGHARDRIDPS